MTFLDMVKEQRLRAIQLRMISLVFIVILFSLLCAIIAMASEPAPTPKSPSRTEGVSYLQ